MLTIAVFFFSLWATAAEKGDDRVSDAHASRHCDIYHNGMTMRGSAPISFIFSRRSFISATILDTLTYTNLTAGRREPRPSVRAQGRGAREPS
jgi:hypothetical protein